jgi:hypothetical protein
MKRWFIGLAIVLGGVILFESLFIVDPQHFAALSRSGRPAGYPVLHAGVHLKLPWYHDVHYFSNSVAPSLENSLLLTPLYVQYRTDPDAKFKQEAADLKQRIGTGRYVRLGFATFFDLDLPSTDLRVPISSAQLSSQVEQINTIVKRAHENQLIVHISLVSGFFHGWNAFRESAIRQDVRNAQWFADGWIAPESDLKDPQTIPHTVWITPSRYAVPFRSRVEESVRTIGAHLAQQMAKFPETLVSIAGDGEVELTYERNFLSSGEKFSNLKEVIYADYSPFMVAEFRDWLRRQYAGDSSPATDDDGDGRTFNRDFGQTFTTWRLRYYDESGPIPYDAYCKLTEKLPTSGPYFINGGFDAPRSEKADPRLWKAWLEFRKRAIANWVRDFAVWVTSSPDPETGFKIPADRYYSYQIPADMIFGQSDSLRLKTSASYVDTAFIDPLGSTGVTAFNGYNGKKHFKTATPQLFSALFLASDNWGILEYNPSIPYDNKIPPSADADYYYRELLQVYAFRPHVLVPFAWTDLPEHKRYNIKGAAFERGLRRLVQEVGDTPWFSWRQVLK